MNLEEFGLKECGRCKGPLLLEDPENMCIGCQIQRTIDIRDKQYKQEIESKYNIMRNKFIPFPPNG